MKKLVCAALACVFLLTACGKTGADVTSETSETTAATETAVAEVSTTTQATTTEATETTTEPTTTTEKLTETTTQATTTEKQTEKEEKVEMPEIVFIVLANQFSSENVIYGYFINNKGEIRYYEYLDERYEAYTPPPNENEWGVNYFERFYNMNFSSVLLEEMYDTIIETSVDTGERVEEEKLNELYEQLLSVDTSNGYDDNLDEELPCVEPMNTHYFGVRKNKTKQEKILLCGCGIVYYLNMDEAANEISEYLGCYIFPKMDLYYVPKLLQTEDNKEDE